MTKRVYFRRVLAVFLAAAMLLGFGAIGAAAERSGGLTYIVVNGEVTITNYNGSDTDVVIPNAFDGYPVTAIGNVAFSGCTSLTSVTIPDSVTSIGSYAFESCTSLTSITIPDSITSISSFAFCDCTSLTFVTIPDSVTSIGSYAYCNCTSQTSITLPHSVTSIGSAA
ncbi:MAG: leucine-rich repeat domain-containing protein, partial [Oscillospiraceae bacterium]|nr:leucine-rich repeat domain-containing protein [Oscillospiraceae bacterium]